jgi:hypothetical protein
VSEARLSRTAGGHVRYQLKTPHRDGTTHVLFESLDFLARLAALAPNPRVHLTRFHGVFAPNNANRALERILAHLDTKAALTQTPRPPPCRAPPVRPLG